jgi:K+-sensing histidine kinase KdpD
MAVVAIGGNAETMQGTIVCCVTATSEARAAAQLAAALASRLDLRLVLAHVVDAHREDADDEAALMALTGALSCAAELRIVHGSRLDALTRVTSDEGADLIVLGARTHGARGRQLRCPLASQLEEAQSVPVLIAPPATRARSSRRLRLAETAPQR